MSVDVFSRCLLHFLTKSTLFLVQQYLIIITDTLWITLLTGSFIWGTKSSGFRVLSRDTDTWPIDIYEHVLHTSWHASLLYMFLWCMRFIIKSINITTEVRDPGSGTTREYDTSMFDGMIQWRLLQITQEQVSCSSWSKEGERKRHSAFVCGSRFVSKSDVIRNFSAEVQPHVCVQPGEEPRSINMIISSLQFCPTFPHWQVCSGLAVIKVSKAIILFILWKASVWLMELFFRHLLDWIFRTWLYAESL